MTTVKLNLYRHYKNKPYKYTGVVRHSETLEELVLYDTLYDNDLSRTWVRPKDLFESSTEVDGEQVPRFRQIPFEVEAFEQFTPEHKELVDPLFKTIFGEFLPENSVERLAGKGKVLTQLAWAPSSQSGERELAGFKIGFEQTPDRFYSWMGGVSPDYRGIGLAKSLMTMQHDWCKDQGYKIVETKTKNMWRDMLLLNIRHGFNVVGTSESRPGNFKILLEKELTPEGN